MQALHYLPNWNLWYFLNSYTHQNKSVITTSRNYQQLQIAPIFLPENYTSGSSVSLMRKSINEIGRGGTEGKGDTEKQPH